MFPPGMNCIRFQTTQHSDEYWNNLPIYGTHYEVRLNEWVGKIFTKQNPSPENISAHGKDYEKFRTYLSTKGDYTPHPRFIEKVFTLITTHTFNINELQSIETLIFLEGLVPREETMNHSNEDNIDLYSS